MILWTKYLDNLQPCTKQVKTDAENSGVRIQRGRRRRSPPYRGPKKEKVFWFRYFTIFGG